MHRTKPLILNLLFFLFFLSFIVLLALLAFTRYAPETVISLVETFVREEEPEALTLTGVGVIGDSTSDEYRGDDNRGLTYATTTLNWVELLHKYRNINFGRWGKWEEPRRVGYAYNWSRTGATVNSMLESRQHVGVAEQVKRGEVNLVIIAIGANDYAPYITPDGYDAIYSGTVSTAEIRQKNNRIVADITTAIDTIRESGTAKILLMKIPDWGNHFGIRVAFPLPEQRGRVSEAISYVNQELDLMAGERSIETLDPNIFYSQALRESEGKITLGDVQMNAFLPSDEPHSVFLDDGVHLGTMVNGLYANFIIAAVNEKYGTTLRQFSQRELQAMAGM